MFVRTTTLLAIVKAKDETIVALQDELRWLRRMVQPDRSLAPEINVEADLVLEGRQDQIQSEDKDAIDSEAARILSGTY